jgi:hypothetical protein
MKDMLAHFKDFCKEAAECERIAKVATSTLSLKRKKGAATQPCHGYIRQWPDCGTTRTAVRQRLRGSDFVIVIYGI